MRLLSEYGKSSYHYPLHLFNERCFDASLLCSGCSEGHLIAEHYSGKTYQLTCNHPQHVRTIYAYKTPGGCKRVYLQQSTDAVAHRGDGFEYWDGSRKRFMSNKMWNEIGSRVTTHEGQELGGKAGRNYMNRHSKQCLGKDLSGQWNRPNLKYSLPKVKS